MKNKKERIIEMMNRTELKMEELEQVAGGSVLEFFYQDLGFGKVILWWEDYKNIKSGGGSGCGNIAY